MWWFGDRSEPAQLRLAPAVIRILRRALGTSINHLALSSRYLLE